MYLRATHRDTHHACGNNSKELRNVAIVADVVVAGSLSSQLEFEVFSMVNVAFINLKTYNKVICSSHVQQAVAAAAAAVAVCCCELLFL